MENSNHAEKRAQLFSEMDRLKEEYKEGGENIMNQLRRKNLDDAEIKTIVEIIKQLEEEDKPEWMELATLKQLGANSIKQAEEDLKDLKRKNILLFEDFKIEKETVYISMKPSNRKLMMQAMENTGIKAEDIKPGKK